MNILQCSGCGCHSSYPVRSCLWGIGEIEREREDDSGLAAGEKRREGEWRGRKMREWKEGGIII